MIIVVLIIVGRACYNPFNFILHVFVQFHVEGYKDFEVLTGVLFKI